METFQLENTEGIIFICAEEGMESEDSKTCSWLYKDFHIPEGQIDKQFEYPATQKFYNQGSVLQKWKQSSMCICTSTHV